MHLNVSKVAADQSASANREASSDFPLRLALREKIDSVMSFMRSCACCGRIEIRCDLFCEKCEEALILCQNRGEGLSQPGYPFPVSSLFTWSGATDLLVRPMIYALKGGWQLRAFSDFAERLSFEKSPRRLGGNLVFVPPPPRPGKSRFDHAWVLANCFARKWEGRVWSGLERPKESQMQKNRSRQERAGLRFGPGSVANELEGVDRVIFVDDVITTGATALAVYMALGDPESFEVWTLVNRPNLAGFKVI